MDTNKILSGALTDYTMDIAIKDKTAQYEKEQRENEDSNNAKQNQNQQAHSSDEDELDADEKEIIERMKQAKLNELRARDDYEDKKKKEKKEEVWYGEYTEIVESEFLPYVTKAKYSLCHFYHKDFERCKIIDFHLGKIAPEHKECKFLKLDAEKTPFFVGKLAVKVLPTICIFKDGVLIDRITGFEDFGGKDDFKTIDLARRLVKSGALKANNQAEKGFKLNRGGNNKDDSGSDDDF